jgi:drug/metabolite transporter (DMT)-like permease
MLVAWMTLGEVPTGPQYLGVALVLAGVWVAMTRSTVNGQRSTGKHSSSG